MTNDKFIEILRYIRLPRGTLLYDGTTYRLCKQDFPPRKFREDLDAFEKMLVLSDGNDNVVGGILFYGNVDIQVVILPRFRKRGYMSAIHKNGIMESECYPNQKVSIAVGELGSMLLLRNSFIPTITVMAGNSKLHLCLMRRSWLMTKGFN